MLKKLILLVSVFILFSACEKKTAIDNNKKDTTTVEKKVESKKDAIADAEDDEKIKLIKEKSLSNHKKFKLNLVLVTQVGCGACEKVKEYMKEKDLKDLIKKDFIVQEVDINFKEELPFSWMQPYATPTLYFLDDKNEEVIDTVVARLTKEQLTEKMQEAIEMRDMD